MTVRQSAAGRPRPVHTVDRLAAEERIAFEHEHGKALAAARTLAERLDLTGTHAADRKIVQELIRRLADEVVGGPPCHPFTGPIRIDDTQYISTVSQKRIEP